MADLEQLENALRNAHKAGDVVAARKLASAIIRQRRGVPEDFQEVGRYKDGVIYRKPDGELSFTSPGYSTTNQDQIGKMMEGLNPHTPEVGIGEGASRSGLQGATFYAGDEIVAAGSAALHPVFHGESGTDFSQRYDAYLGRERAKIDRFKETNENIALASEIAGGVVGAGIGGGAGATFMKGAQGAKSLAVGGALDGALYGGTAGFANAEGGFLNRLAGAGWGAGAGMGVGGVAAPAFAGASALGRSFLEKIRRSTGTPEKQAAARLRHAAKLSDLTTDDIANKLDDLGPEGMLIDTLGEEGRSLARNAANKSPTAREILEQVTVERMSGQPDRLADSVKRAANLDQAYTLDELIEAAGDSAKPRIREAYELARSLGYDIDETKFFDIGATSIGSDAYNHGHRLAKDRMIAEAAAKGPVPLNVLKNGPSRFDILDETKKSLDARAQPALGQKQTNEQAIAGNLSRTIRDRIDEYMPEYGGARELARNLHRQEDAIRLGAEGAKPHVPADFPRRTQATDSVFDTDVAQGYASGKLDQIENRRGTPGLVDAVFGSSRQQGALSAALKDKAADVRRQIAAEREFGRTHTALTGNSGAPSQIAGSGLFPEASIEIATNGTEPGALMSSLIRPLSAGALRMMSSRNDEAVLPVLAELMKGREIPIEAVEKVQQSPALQRLLMRFLAQQGGATASASWAR